MQTTTGITLETVKDVYNGPEGDLWELIMGEQIHIGGFVSSTDLADRAGLAEGLRGVDLCCCNGAGMRFLARFRGAEGMTGVDAAETVVDRGRKRCENEGFSGRIEFVQADVLESGLPDAAFDFVWGEDAWCYVTDKERLVAEAVRLVRPGGTIAFTDWVEGPAGLSGEEARRFLAFMKFPGVQDIPGYKGLLEKQGCEVIEAGDTGRFAPYIDLYLEMLNKQLAYDALKIIGFDQQLLEAMGGEMVFMQGLAHAGKIAQGLFVARRK